MKEHLAYVVHRNGNVEKWTVKREGLNVTDAIAAQFQKSAPVKLLNAFKVRDMSFNIHFETGNPGHIFCLTTLPHLPLRVALIPSPLAKKDENILVPSLVDNSSVKTIDMIWRPPDNCTLVYMTQTHPKGSSGWYYTSNNFLYAYSDTGIYKLPLGNLYEDCKVCTGEYNSNRETIADSVQASLDQFINSKWNTHLINEMTKCHKMFRWQATDSSFNQLVPDGNWKSISSKVSVPYVSYITSAIPPKPSIF